MILLESALDYAGLFPPTSLGMTEAVRAYAGHRRGPHRALLGRFVVPLARLEELAAAADEVLAGDAEAGWDLSVIGGGDPREESQRIAELEARHAGGRSFSVRSIERRVEGVEEIGHVVGAYHDGAGRSVYLEIPSTEDGLGERIEAIAHSGACAKVRTGGTSAEAFPTAGALARFVVACSAAGIAFKATAGLHHAVRGEHRVDPGAATPCATMHGFLNLFVGAVLLDAGRIDAEELRRVLEERAPDAFRLSPGGARWRDRETGAGEIRRARERLVHSFGTCSFEEPVQELRQMGALP